ncbi:hypothetical protein ACCS91_39525, partial [Rhizobium ruizarguesonis]
LDHFGLEELRDLPGLEELKGAGFLSGRIPANFNIPSPLMNDELTEDEGQVGGGAEGPGAFELHEIDAPRCILLLQAQHDRV